MKNFGIAVLVLGVLASCNKKENEKNFVNHTSSEVVQEGVTDKNEAPETYEGVFPCSDCNGIKTTLTLNQKDWSYHMISDYMDKEKFENTGTFTWDVTKKFITLTDGEDAEEQQVFYVSDEGLFLVSEVGSEDIKEDYHLIKK
ncbi:copper resistance protein NlpE N-terminal domain-containing protein [Riemerella anatipestifer]|uniref:copper resistance protein NlpE n=1 Tax=Riemerella anatipestifer TaxID=34085 RepID=UPI0002FB5EA9|nr:copper resistance protein NlpE [Riemerella anatipestifer]MBT0563073.1 copper resistance protein NlpE N-terminal domain-containing protein [Riemerella anatipestifer]MDY3516209.1 copper resistance protein NlpE [Riemerella anatipestifer]OBP54537.1 copper resistance protein NlpE [Riemerella anatipestifer]OBP58206.1 copper resistance protein NlpE [Riemerella anatipestifer]QZO85446.1 copper resistance protein NlpE [Riemerella anatipestifer]